MAATTLAGKLVEAFGDPQAMNALYADDVRWTLSASTGALAGPHVGRAAVVAFNTTIWTEFYFADGVTVEILDEVGNDRLSAVRFIYNARYKADNSPYSNEYTVFARHPDGRKITEVFEGLDTSYALQRYTEATGKTIQP
ncbi:nuclear transport factor 2 family protein [Zavarzinia sp. CC-PAN008]|uniref:nuclear transport factor 2 family protein n=1 Tax=Zavarzinia sp. CC-PAN008 TaxID=3243332 RepID=UPI003F748B15